MSALRLDPAPARSGPEGRPPSARGRSASPKGPPTPPEQPSPDRAGVQARGSEDAAAHGRELAEHALDGDRRALARLLTEIEARSAAGEAGLRALYPRAGAAHLVGVTGAPGAGKSTLVSALIGEARRQGRAVAVVAIDPSSPITGGALLGDRVRMQAHAGDRDVFIRSMASRGQAGGLAPAAADAAAVLDAVGFPLVFMETVGSGQSEVAIASTADTTVVVEAPEMGDEVQAIKAGLLEVADVVVVSKGDRPGAQRAAAQLRAMLTVGAQHDRAAAAAGRRRPKRPEVLLVTAPEAKGVPELLAALDRRHAARSSAEGPAEARLARARAQLEGILAERLRARLEAPAAKAHAAAAVAAIAAHEIDPYAAADALLDGLPGGPPEASPEGRPTAEGSARDVAAGREAAG